MVWMAMCNILLLWTPYQRLSTASFQIWDGMGGIVGWPLWYPRTCLIIVFHSMHKTLQWSHNGRDGVSNHQRPDCLRNGLFRHWSKETAKLRGTGLCEGNSPGTGEFPAQKASNAKMSPFDDVIMKLTNNCACFLHNHVDYQWMRYTFHAYDLMLEALKLILLRHDRFNIGTCISSNRQ